MNQNAQRKDGVPSFLIKTYEMLDGDQFGHLIRWTQNGQSFVVYNQHELAQKVLPNFFKHRNYPSFLRQLNMYNFKKTKNEYGFSEFRHKWFRKGLKSLLKYIKRRNQEQSTEHNDVEVKGDADSCKNEHVEMNSSLKNILETQQQMQQEFNTALQQSSLWFNEAQTINQLIRNTESVTQKKFDKLAGIVSKIVSGIDNPEIQGKLNLLFSQALVGEDGLSLSDFASQGPIANELDNNNTLVPQRFDLQFSLRDLVLYSGGNSPYRSFEIASPFYNLMCQKMNQTLIPREVIPNVLLDPNLFIQLNNLQHLQMQYSQPQLALPPSIPMQISQVLQNSLFTSQRSSVMSSPLREDQKQM